MNTELQKCAEMHAGHIANPMSIDEILQEINSNEYSAELILQHLLLWAAKNTK